MTILLTCDKVEKNLGTRVLFTGLDLQVHTREHIGLIGPNGTGKSTLMKMLAGLDAPDGGSITLNSALKVVYLPQEEAFNPRHTVLEAAVEASHADPQPLHAREAAAQIALGQIGFTDMAQHVGGLSGGWKKRLAIARALARTPDLLLLDEPTNHLDIDGIRWLEGVLARANFTFMLITHDRMFLQNATSRVVELAPTYPGGSLSFNCAYGEFIRRRDDFLEAEQARLESLKNKNRREQAWVRAGVKARGTKQRARLDEADALADEVSDLHRRVGNAPAPVTLAFEASERKTKRLVTLHKVSKSYGDKHLIQNLDLTLTPGKRVGLLGLNGVGKTTLMRLIAGEEQPDSGGITTVAGCRILHYQQHRDMLDGEETLKQALSPAGGEVVTYRGKDMHVSAWARKLKFRSDQMMTPVKNLSGGERARVLMGRLMLQTADILLLDEPTNDLDIPSIEILEESLCDYPGALVLVTHDRAMLAKVSTTLLALRGTGHIETFASYSQWQAAEEAKNAPPAKEIKTETAPKPAENKPTKLSYKDQRDWDMMEENILAAEQAVETIQAAPASPADAAAFNRWCENLATAQAEVERLYARWSELEARVAGLQKNG